MYTTTTILHSPFFTKTPLLHTPSLTHLLRSPKPTIFLSPICSSSSSSSDGGSQNTDETPSPPPNTVEIRFRRVSKRRQRQRQSLGGGDQPMMAQTQSQTRAPTKEARPAKTWEEMNLSEKLLELYVGEKGALYWLNKFAYASIFIVIGGWILFRFVGPALNLYQLDAPPLPPDAMFKG